jgi:GT2 family glycosyltransferase
MANQSPRISVIIPAHNAEKTILSCLDALKHQTAPPDSYEIIVVDDGSGDKTHSIVSNNNDVRLFKQENFGPSAARNLGLQNALGEITLFTDADCAPVPDWIEHMSTPFENEQIVGVKGTYLTRQQEVVARFVQLEYEDKYDRMRQDEYIDFIDTHSAGYRREVLLANEGFDPTFPVASTEDQELSFRLARQGYKMVFVPEAKVYHLEHPSNFREYWRKKFNIGYWKVVVHKHHPDKLWRDSHTPQMLKLQILLVGFMLLFLLAGVIWMPFVWASALMGLVFLLSTIPFMVKAWPKDRIVALASPGLLFLRALALGTGFASGLLFNLRQR